MSDRVSSASDRSLERSLGLLEALTIGVGTMIGAGIFVFPGIASGQAGMAATLSYAIGMFIALLVALPAAELATAMPESGGGYYFVSRGLGSVWSTVTGIGQWLGLTFATAFYLMGFSVYLLEIIRGLGFSPGRPVTLLSVTLCVILTGVNVLGTKNSGSFQTMVVVVLLAILTVFTGYGLTATFLGSAAYSPAEHFAPFGYGPVVTTAALVFTSYLGFAQIATVAGEIKRPARNLPLAMLGSVVLVGLLYVLAVIICNMVYSPGRLAELGETALIDVGGLFFGLPGRITMMFGGLLATISSANASIMSSSRALYAISRDGVLPEQTATVSRRFGTPHISLLLTGSFVAVLLVLGGLELLAEVASLLHLVMYGLICVSVIALRLLSPDWYDPDFRLPGYPLLPALGGVCSFGIIAFMRWSTILSGTLVIAVGIAWHYLYVRKGVSSGESPK